MFISFPAAAIRLGCVVALASLTGIASTLKAHHVPGDDHSGVMLSVDPQKPVQAAPQGVKAMYPTRAEAEAAAPLFGCQGAHAMGEQWMPCSAHSQGQHAGN